MSNLSFKERAERLERGRGVSQVTSGSSATAWLLPPERLSDLRTISAIQALTRRGVTVPLAKTTVEAIVHTDVVAVYVPRLETQKRFAAELAVNGVRVVFEDPSVSATSPGGG